MAFEAYRIAIRLSLVENVTAGLTRLSANFARAGMDASALQKHLDKIAKTTLVGTALTASGGFLLKSLQGPLEEAKKFQTEQARFAALGLGDKALQDATKYAESVHVIGNSARDAFKTLRETTTIMGSLDHAMEVTPLLLKSRFAMRSVMDPEKAETFENQFQAAIKTTELRGAVVNRDTGQVDAEKFRRMYNMMGQAYVASGGLVKPSDYLAGIKTGGVSAKLMNDEAFFFGLGHFMQESGGSRTGTAMMSQFQNWVMGRMPQRIAEDMQKIGLLQQGAIHYGKTGHITRVDAEGLVRSKEFVDNPFKYMNEVVVPLLEKKGFHGNNLNLKLASLFGIRTASNLADQMVREQLVANQYIERSKRAANWEQLADIGGKTLQGKEVDLEAKWQDLMRELGTTILPMAVAGLDKLNSGLKVFAEFADKHPTITTVGMSLIALGGTLGTIGGAVVLSKAALLALSPLLGAGTGLAGIIGRLLPLLGGGGGLTGLLSGAAGAIVGGAGLGVALGTLIYKLGEGTNAMNTFGRWLTIVLAKLGNEDAKADLDREEKYNQAQNGVRLTPSAVQRLNDPRLVQLDADFKRRTTTILPPIQVPGLDKPVSVASAAVQPQGGASPTSQWQTVPKANAKQTVQVTSVVKMNDREIARAVTTHQADQASKPQSGSRWFDSGMAPAPVNFSY